MEVDVEKETLLPSEGRLNGTSDGREINSRDSEDMIREDTTYQPIPDDHAIEIEPNVRMINIKFFRFHLTITPKVYN